MRLGQPGFCIAIAAVLLFAAPVDAEDASPLIAPLPTSPSDGLQKRITPEMTDGTSQGIYTTRKMSDVPAMTENVNAPNPPLPQRTIPFTSDTKPLATTNPPVPATAAKPLPAIIPFGRAAPSGPVIPSTPHIAIAVPVVDVDAAEAAAAAPPTPIAPAADPVAEDPAQPTELTSPMFDATSDNGSPRKMIFRVLNKVTGQSALLEAKPGEHLTFGQIRILAIMCRASAPTSQADFAGLLEISEHLPGKADLKPFFRGWMYASSPSITALEHPVYDVTMVSCDIAGAKPEKEATSDDKSAKKSSKKAKR
jgi:hypothetical protein